MIRAPISRPRSKSGCREKGSGSLGSFDSRRPSRAGPRPVLGLGGRRLAKSTSLVAPLAGCQPPNAPRLLPTRWRFPGGAGDSKAPRPSTQREVGRPRVLPWESGAWPLATRREASEALLSHAARRRQPARRRSLTFISLHLQRCLPGTGAAAGSPGGPASSCSAGRPAGLLLRLPPPPRLRKALLFPRGRGACLASPLPKRATSALTPGWELASSAPSGRLRAPTAPPPA